MQKGRAWSASRRTFSKPFSSDLSHFRFTPDEKATLFELKNDKLLNDTLLLEPMHYHFVESLSTLNRLIFELVEKTVPVEMKGDRGRLELPHDEYAKLRPRMVQVNSLIEQLRDEASSDAEAFGTLLEKLTREYKEKLCLPFIITAPLPDEQSLSS